MIPARLGSKRVKDKNLRMLGNKPLVQYVIETGKQIFSSDDIYLNSSFDIFKTIAQMNSIQFYKRPDELSTDTATNDEFMYDFLKHINCDYVIQVNPTSPFLSKEDLSEFKRILESKSLDYLIGVKREQIEAVYKNNPINFDRNSKMKRSQDLEPIYLFTSPFGFKRETFIRNYERYGHAMFGTDNDAIEYFPLTGYSTIDIDWETDFQLAEAILETFRRKKSPRYFNPSERIEINVPDIMKKDGVNSWREYNASIINVDKVISQHKAEESWAERIINSSNNSATIICQNKGEGNRRHYHPDWCEWWYILDGEWDFEIEGNHTIVKPGDIVFIPAGRWHRITALRDKSIRIAVSREDVAHIYKR